MVAMINFYKWNSLLCFHRWVCWVLSPPHSWILLLCSCVRTSSCCVTVYAVIIVLLCGCVGCHHRVQASSFNRLVQSFKPFLFSASTIFIWNAEWLSLSSSHPKPQCLSLKPEPVYNVILIFFRPQCSLLFYRPQCYFNFYRRNAIY